MPSEEKKVEYIELIYDLIFVYVIGRNSSLLQNVEGGFVSGRTFFIYVLCSLAVIQIWNYSTYYVNMFGRNSVRNYIMLFINMYLLYYMGEGTRVYWEYYQNQYHAAWGLILINLGIQYAIERRRYLDDPEALGTINSMMVTLFGEAAIVLAAIPLGTRAGLPLVAAAIAYGLLTTWLLAHSRREARVDFPHLTERAMLYVVFTFGEMIIVIATYFEGALTFRNVYFSAMAFLIVVALFLCYGLLYDRILDRQMTTAGTGFMLLHIFLIFGLNCLTTSLQFMRDTTVAVWPKILMLTASFAVFFVCLFLLQIYAKPELKLCSRYLSPIIGITAAFVSFMILLRINMFLNILITVLYVFAVFFHIRSYSRRASQKEI